MSTSYKTKYMHFTVHCTSSVMLVSGIKHSQHWMSLTDTCESHFSFAVYSTDPLEFASNLQRCIDNRDSQDNYWKQDWIEIKCNIPHDIIRIQRDNASIGITRGNLKVLYFGNIDVLRGLPDAIEREYRRYVEKSDKEAQEWAKQ